ncbi:TIGR03560 family F420-dependent LLM class oxidoreductase [Microbacterium sp. KR10-403]|uniref:TIGR03560 family F420-dependent LLM class oxidoreductase n=1 Tax=Microbacterium sp. KR10-403 TaxID=3158581 RepID=UPI0032E514EF
MEFCVFTEPQQGFSYDEQRTHAQTAEKLGFDGWFRSDHYMRMGAGSPLPGPTDAWTTLAGLAVQTSRIRLGTLVSSVTYRTPGVLAIQVAQVDAMSGGRAELGLGTGWFDAEHKAYGIPFPAKRFGMLEEQLELITGLWAATAPYSFAGAHYELVDSPALPKPVQERVPVIVGGGGVKRTPALAARFATEFNIGFQPEDVIAEKFAGVRAACEAADRDPASLKLSVALPTLVGVSESELSRRAAAIGRDAAAVRGDDVIAGTPDEVVAKVARLQALGAERVYFQLPDQRDLEHLELLGSLLPQLRAL